MLEKSITTPIAECLSVAQAQARLRESVSCKKALETIAVSSALGRVASVDVVSDLAIPPNDNSAMDGFAVRSAEINGDAILLPISQRIPAGSFPEPLKPGTAARIFTGGVLPEGADAVVIQENCDYDESQVTIGQTCVARRAAARVPLIVTKGDNVRRAGQDIEKGATVLHQGQKLSAIDLSLLASIGCAQVEVVSRLKVAVFSTGDELVDPGQPLKPGQIYNSNRTLLMALCTQLGYTAIDCGIVEDTLSATKIALSGAALNADVVISSGGVSVGEEDHIKPAIEDLGSLDLWRVQMKPGKPVAFGYISGVPFLGLPGNPVSSFVVFQLLGVPLLQSLQGQLAQNPRAYSVVSGFSKKTTTREEYIRVRLALNDQGQLVGERFANLSSGVMSSLSWADGLVRHCVDQAIEVNQVVEFLPLTEGML